MRASSTREDHEYTSSPYFGIIIFGILEQRIVTVAAVTGVIIPDLSLYLLAVWELSIEGTSAKAIYGQMYYCEYW